METLEAVNKRCSLKTHLSGREVELEKINKVLDAARMAPSARNMQPWRFVVVRGKRSVESLVDAALGEGNAVAKEAAALIVVCARPRDSVIHERKEYYLFDTGLAVENMLLAATDLGLVTHPMAGVNESELKRLLNIPRDVRVVLVTPLAYPREASFDAAARERLQERTRRTLEEVVYYDQWNEPEPA